MRVVVIEDNEISSKVLEHLLMDEEDIVWTRSFADPMSALEFMRENPVDVVLLDIDLPGINGIQVAQRISEFEGVVPLVIFITAHEEYAVEAFGVDAVDYIIKPCDRARLRRALGRAVRRREMQPSENINERPAVRFVCFGEFQMLLDNRAVIFKSEKARELLAYLVDHKGAAVSMGDVIEALWEDRPYDERVKNLYRVTIYRLRRQLCEVGLADLLHVSKGKCWIDIKDVRCDYYDFLAEPSKACEQFSGEYMSSYSWGERTLAQLDMLCYNRRDDGAQGF